MFEYAIGHWLQKSTEHVMGCVLCSPGFTTKYLFLNAFMAKLKFKPNFYYNYVGCFSLFRARAVMDDNVMRTYTTVSTEPRHFVQYDQV